MYIVEINKSITDDDKNSMLTGTDIGKNETGKFYDIRRSKRSRYEYKVSLYSGKNREIRRVFSKFGYRIKSLKRISYGQIKVDGINLGSFRHLDDSETSSIFN